MKTEQQVVAGRETLAEIGRRYFNGLGVSIVPAPVNIGSGDCDGGRHEPVQEVMNCPVCFTAHIDDGEWSTRPHKTHQCQHCGHEWRPYDHATVGVAAK